MTVKLIQRNIPPERENTNDRFRVQYNDKNAFKKLEVKVVRMANGEQQTFEFTASLLPNTDSISFTTSIVKDKLQVTWNSIQPSSVIKNHSTGIPEPSKKILASAQSTAGKTAFAPIANENSTILILGTMPGERSLALQQYYGHAGNHFWKIMYSLLEKPFSKEYEDRMNLLLVNKVALWDVLEYCESKGSADSAISNEKANDFNSFYRKYPKIKHVFFSSKKAEEFYYKFVGKKDSINYDVLPSPSSANTWRTFEEKLLDWKLILKHI